MSNNKDQSFVAENGITLGIIVLALFVVLGVGLPRWIGNDESHNTAKIALPDSLSKTLNAADLQSSFDPAVLKKQGATDAQVKQFLASVATTGKQTAAEDRSASNALGFTTASRTYVSKDFAQQVQIRAFLGDGSAFFPQTGGQTTSSRVGDAVCFTSSQQDQTTGQTQTMATCSHASRDLTVQATAGSKGDAAKYANQIFEKLS